MHGIFLSSLFITLATFGFVFTAPTAEAGIIAQQVKYAQGSAKRDKSTIKMSKNRMLIQELNAKVYTIFDLNTKEIILVNMQTKQYTRAKTEEYIDHRQKLMEKAKAQMLKEMKTMPPDRKAQMEDMMRTMGFLPSKNGDKVREITYTATDEKPNIAGYDTQKFIIYENGILSEQIWITRNPVFQKEFDMGKLADFMEKLKKEIKMIAGYEKTIGDDKVLEDIYSKGFPLRTVRFGSAFGGALVEEIKSVQFADIPESEFRPPKGYRRVSIADMEISLGR